MKFDLKFSENAQKLDLDFGQYQDLTDGGYERGYVDGKQAEKLEFWNAFTNNQKRTDYSYAFYNWYSNAFYPTCDIGGTNMSRAFYMCGTIDLITRCRECGIVIDFSKATNVHYCFGSSNILTIPTVDLSKTTTTVILEGTFNNSKLLTTIEKLIVTEKVKYNNNTFNCIALEEIRFEGVIASDITFQYCPLLSLESAKDIINHLSTDTSGLTVTLPKVAVNREFGINVDDPFTYPEGSEWYELRNSRSNWTFNFS